MATDWMILTGGQPAEPDSLDELAKARRPKDFWRSLFDEVAKVDVSASTTVEQSEIPREERVARGYCGTSDVGYRWNEREPLESSMFPTEVTDETYGLPGIDAIWNYRLAQVGQAGRAAFRHGELRVRFKTGKERDAFSAAWQRVFGRSPSFGTSS